MESTKFEKKDLIKKSTDFIKDIDTDYDYLNESIHSKNLYDGVLTLMNADNHIKLLEFLELAEEPIRKDIKKIFEHMCICSNMSKYFFENKALIRNLVLKDILTDITLDNIPEIKSNLEEVDTAYFYSEELLRDLRLINKSLGERFSESVSNLLRFKHMISKLREPIQDSDYLEDDDELVEYFLDTYRKLDYDRLEDICGKKQTYTPEEIHEISDILYLEHYYDDYEIDFSYISQNIYYGHFFNLARIHSAYKKFIESADNNEK